MVHANGRDPVRDAVKAGCDSVEHGFFMGRENLDRMASCGTAWVPTACTMSACSRIFPPGSDEAAGARRTLDHQVLQIMEARRAGVTIVLGTDSGGPGVLHGRSAAMEIGIFLDAGMTPQEAVRCATWNGAELLGLSHWTGLLIHAHKVIPQFFLQGIRPVVLV
ncbi:MAG: amidohydrolase family protein [Thermodesulfobacteriota bacterium]